MDSSDLIKLVSNDAKEFQVPTQVAKCSKTIGYLIESIGDDGEAIPLTKVTGEILEKVIAWAEHHKNDPETDDMVDKATMKIGKWDADFLKMDQTTLFEVVLAANFLDIQPLLTLTCKAVADILKDKSPEDIRKIFNLTNDFTEAEEEQVKKENEWCEEK